MASPISSSSSSVSSGSGRQAGGGLLSAERGEGGNGPPRTDKAELNKPHGCSWPGCGKTFSRPDHLARHKLNHAPKEIYACERCPKTFVRLDLLIRHNERHDKRQEQDNADLPPRKRAKSDLRGSQPAPPPVLTPSTTSLEERALAAAAFSSNNGLAPPPDEQFQAWQQAQHAQFGGGAGVGRPGYATVEVEGGGGLLGLGSPLDDFAALPPDAGLFPGSTTALQGFESAASQTDHLQASIALSAGFDGLQQPSFDLTGFGSNAPTDTPSSLFEPQQVSRVQFGEDSVIDETEADSWNAPDPSLFEFLQAGTGGAPFISADSYDWLLDTGNNFDFHLAMSRPASPGFDPFAGFIPNSSAPFTNVPGGPTDSPAAFHDGLASEQLAGWTADTGFPALPFDSASQLLQTLNSLVTPEPIDPTRVIDEPTQKQLIDYLGPGFAHLQDDPLWSTEALSGYMASFWGDLHQTQSSAIHRASFRTASAPPALLLAMISLGCYYGSIEAHALAVAIHPVLRGRLFTCDDFRPRAPLWVHQALRLILLFGSRVASTATHEMAHILWPSSVTIGRRSAIFSQRVISLAEHDKDDVELRWQAWIEEESAKRCGFFSLLVDVQHAALFRHAPTLSAFQIQLHLPADEAEWSAPDAMSWAAVHDRPDLPVSLPFLAALKAGLSSSDESEAILASLSPFSRILLLHGIMAVAQDLQWRDHVVGMSQSATKTVHWREMISTAYEHWKVGLDEALLAADEHTSKIMRASVSLYVTGLITMSIDCHELGIFAGATSALGLVATPPVIEATKARVRGWASTKEGRTATWHAARFLHDTLEHAKGVLDTSLSHSRAVVIAYLTVYAFGVATSGEPAPLDGQPEQAGKVYLARLCTETPNGLLAVPHKNNLLPLTEIVMTYIKSSIGARWELTTDALALMRGILRDGQAGGAE